MVDQDQGAFSWTDPTFFDEEELLCRPTTLPYVVDFVDEHSAWLELFHVLFRRSQTTAVFGLSGVGVPCRLTLLGSCLYPSDHENSAFLGDYFAWPSPSTQAAKIRKMISY